MSRDLPSDDGSPGDIEVGPADGPAESPPELQIQEIDRIFNITEQAIQGDVLDRTQTNHLIGLFERAVAGPAQTDPETVAEFVSAVEELIIQPDEFEQANVEGLLSIFEQALAPGTDQERTNDLLSVAEAAIRDPTSVNPADLERFRSGIEQTITDLADPYAGPFSQLFGLSQSSDIDPELLDDGEFETIRLARLGAAMTQRATGYSLESGVRTGTRMGYAAMNAQSPADLLTEVRAISLDELQRSGIDIGERQSEWLDAHEDALVADRPITSEQLKQRGEQLLSKSAEVGRSEAFHPAYPSILEELAADEARILRLLATEGRQASLDVYNKPYIPFKSTLVARNLSMVGSDSGCRNPTRTPIYLQNLDRLGLIRFSDEPVENLKRYQVLDAQPHIEAAIEQANRPKTVYGAIQLTELGMDFCEYCLPVTVDHAAQRRRFRGETSEPQPSESESGEQ